MVNSVSFSENFVNLLNKWSLWQFPEGVVIAKYLEMKHFVVNVTRQGSFEWFSATTFLKTLQSRINEFMMPVYGKDLVLAPCHLWIFYSLNCLAMIHERHLTHFIPLVPDVFREYTKRRVSCSGFKRYFSYYYR